MRINKSIKKVVKASTAQNDDSERYDVFKNFNTKDWYVYDDVTDRSDYHFDSEEEGREFIKEILSNPGYNASLPYGGYKPSEDDIDACGEVKASKKVSANDKALTHIKAAIDILGKSGNKDAVTKDSIANLATIMFDIKGSQKG